MPVRVVNQGGYKFRVALHIKNILAQAIRIFPLTQGLVTFDLQRQRRYLLQTEQTVIDSVDVNRALQVFQRCLMIVGFLQCLPERNQGLCNICIPAVAWQLAIRDLLLQLLHASHHLFMIGHQCQSCIDLVLSNCKTRHADAQRD